MRGVASGNMLSPGFFIVMDRLYQTLTEKMSVWARVVANNRGALFGVGSNKPELKHLLLERMIVAYDLAAAFHHLKKALDQNPRHVPALGRAA